MAGQYYSTVSGRLEKYPGRILKKAQKREMLSKLGAMDPMPQNKSEKIEWLRFLPYGGVDNQWIAAGGDTTYVAAHTVAEGVTPTPDTLTYTTINTTLTQIACLYSYTDKTKYVHEEGSEIPMEMEDQSAERIALARELMVYGELKSATSVFYGGSGVGPTTVNGPPDRGMFQNINRYIRGKHGTFMNKMLKSGLKFGTQSVQASFPCFTHTDMEKTFENIPGFKLVNDYGDNTQVLDPEYEIGSLGRVRVIVNPILTYLPDTGAAVGTWSGSGSGKSTTGTLLDVYPMLVIGQGLSGGEFFGQVPLRGFESIDPTHIPVGTKSGFDPHGQRGYVGALTWQAQKILNDGWGSRAYVGTEAN